MNVRHVKKCGKETENDNIFSKKRQKQGGNLFFLYLGHCRLPRPLPQPVSDFGRIPEEKQFEGTFNAAKASGKGGVIQ